ncbi:MAG: sn-glycerol-3-phosphate ABC transporter ATP-binding protein UgpC [Gammaproteobacteria bacterium]|nr:sn-glycerol-3-phosphate ABC transporter ATP-binding protein UgpC [Gammaproteobacteria bacterium]
MSSLEIRGIQKSFSSTQVLKGIDISIDSGDFLVLVGPSGCGKSTLLNMIAGLDSITAGDIVIDGDVVNEVRPSQRDIAMVFQSYALYPNMSVAKNISFGLEMRKVPKDERNQRVASVAQMLQIEPLLDRKPSQLSGGQRQRVAMGRALVRDPKIFLFDEPLSNLDAKLRVDMRTEIKKLHQRVGNTIVYVTHDQVEAMTLATKIAVMKDGELQQLGSPDEVYNNPNNLFVASFMGSPSMNLLESRIIQQDGAPVVPVSLKSGEEIFLPLPQSPAYRKYLNKPVIIGLRPEAITDPGSAEQESSLLYSSSCQIDMIEPTGAELYAIMELNKQEVVSRMRASCGVQSGQTAEVIFNMEYAVLFDPETELRIS